MASGIHTQSLYTCKVVGHYRSHPVSKEEGLIPRRVFCNDQLTNNQKQKVEAAYKGASFQFMKAGEVESAANNYNKQLIEEMLNLQGKVYGSYVVEDCRLENLFKPFWKFWS